MNVLQVHDFEGNLMCEFVNMSDMYEWYNKWKFSGRYCNGKVNFSNTSLPEGHQCKIYVPNLPNTGRPFECFSSTNLTMFVPNVKGLTPKFRCVLVNEN